MSGDLAGWSAGAAALAAWLITPASPGDRARRLLRLDRVRRRRGLPARASRLLPGARRRAARGRLRALEGVQALAAELRAGQPVRLALMRAVPDLVPRALVAARWGGDVPAALREDAARDAQPLWRSVAACWEVAEASGAGLADAIERLVASARAAEEVRTQLAAHLAAPRATARLLATLPVVGLLMGLGLGGDPVGWLLGHPVGQACLVGGIGLTLLGLAWTGRIAARVERSL